MLGGSYIRAHQHAAGAAVCSGEEDRSIVGIGRGGTNNRFT